MPQHLARRLRLRAVLDSGQILIAEMSRHWPAPRGIPGGVPMVKKFPILPANPQRICWGCDRYCSAEAMACGNGSERTPHMSELFGEDWMDWVAPGGEAAASMSAGVEDGGEDGNAGAQQDVAAGAAREERGAAPGGAVLVAKA
jgi:hypothetical protein